MINEFIHNWQIVMLLDKLHPGVHLEEVFWFGVQTGRMENDRERVSRDLERVQSNNRINNTP
jgi:hypothetical protein